MAIDFPNSPLTNDIFTVGDQTWKYDGTKWNIVPVFGVQGPTGPTGAGVAIGGTAGQALTKVDGTNYNTQWSNSVSFLGLQPAITTAANTYAVPGVTPISGNQTYGPTTGVIYYYPCFFDYPVTINAALINVSTLATNGTAELGLYTADSTLQPVTRVASFGTVSTATTGAKTITGLSVSVGRGVHLLALLFLTAAPVLRAQACSFYTTFCGTGGSAQIIGPSTASGQTSLASPPVAWTSISNVSTNSMGYPLFVKWV